MTWLVDPTQRILSGALDGLVARQGLISANLANVDTPGFTPSSIDFESALHQELDAASPTSASARQPADGPAADVGLRVTNPRHLQGPDGVTAGGTTSEFAGSIRNDGNRVDLESELTALSETQLRFEAVTRLTSGRLGQLSDVLSDQGGR